jgi:hypothetical protein
MAKHMDSDSTTKPSITSRSANKTKTGQTSQLEARVEKLSETVEMLLALATSEMNDKIHPDGGRRQRGASTNCQPHVSNCMAQPTEKDEIVKSKTGVNSEMEHFQYRDGRQSGRHQRRHNVSVITEPDDSHVAQYVHAREHEAEHDEWPSHGGNHGYDDQRRHHYSPVGCKAKNCREHLTQRVLTGDVSNDRGQSHNRPMKTNGQHRQNNNSRNVPHSRNVHSDEDFSSGTGYDAREANDSDISKYSQISSTESDGGMSENDVNCRTVDYHR